RAVRLTGRIGDAVQRFYAVSEQRWYEMTAVFFRGEFDGEPIGAGSDELYWVDPTRGRDAFFHACHAWAASQVGYSRSGSVEVAGDLVAASLIAQRRLDLGADRQRLGTARVEAAARRRIERARHLALEDHLLAHVVGMRGERVVEQDLRVGMQRARVELVGGRGLEQLAEVHHADARADVLHHGQVVGDEEIAHAGAILDLAQEVHHLGADRDVERRHRLIQQDALRVRRQRARNGDPLALAARELVRIIIGDAGREPHSRERRGDPPGELGAGG